MAKAVAPAYGTLAAKAEEFVDKHAPALTEAADKLNKMNIEATEKLSDRTTALIVGTEGMKNWWDMFAGWKDILVDLGLTAMAFGGKIKKGFGKVKSLFTGAGNAAKETTKLTYKLNDAGKLVVRNNGKFASAKDLSRMQKFNVGLKKLAFNMKGGVAKAATKATSVVGNLASKAKALGPAAKAGLGKIGPLARVAGGRILGLGAKLVGAKATVIASVANMGYEAMKGVNAAMDAGGDMKDKIGAGLLGAGKGAAEAIDFLTGGLLDKLSSMTNSLGIGFNEAWEKLDFAAIGETFEYMFDSAIQAVKDLLGISSPSKVMMDIGSSMIEGITSMLDADTLIAAAQMMVDALLFPFTSLGSLLMDLVTGAFDLVPDSIKSFMGFETDSTSDTATKLAGATTGGVAAKTGAGAGNNNADPYVINLAMNLDGKEIDKKVINVVGGIAKQATL